MTSLRVCHFHADEGIHGKPTGDEGALEYLCARTTGHPTAGPYRWVTYPPRPDLGAISGLAAELGLDVELPAALKQYAGRWVEYGVVEHAYASRQPDEFASLVKRYGHTAIAAKKYTASAYLARTLGELSRFGSVLYHTGPATGRWSYNTWVSWWALSPEPAWDNPHRLSWADMDLGMDYVPGESDGR
ncbi:MAG: hypothetical protein QOG53_3098 [Frankiales bacterium]|jgi:hypothetical protein|nr:hypothetical protein [Frankiales bacterium]